MPDFLGAHDCRLFERELSLQSSVPAGLMGGGCSKEMSSARSSRLSTYALTWRLLQAYAAALYALAAVNLCCSGVRRC